MHIIIFKTSVITQGQVARLQPLITSLPVVSQCNFDLEDCDNILRVVSTDLQPQLVCGLLQTEGFSCETMESFVVPSFEALLKS